jgi:peptidoglycan pentaglycine glycine transferase (the first glycine)
VTRLLPDTAIERDRWDRFVSGWPTFGLLQSSAWGIFKERLGWSVLRIVAEDGERIVGGAQVLVRRLPVGLGSIAYVPRGPLVPWTSRDAPPLLAAIREAARPAGAIYLRIEPPAPLARSIATLIEGEGFQATKQRNQPRCTMLIDLGPSEDELLAGMRATTRYNIRYSARRGVTVRDGTERDLPLFFALLVRSARRGAFQIRSFDYYRQEWATLAGTGNARMFIATVDGRPIAVRIAVAYGQVAADLHAASLAEHHGLKANDRLVWECLRWAKASGCRLYDLWGIPDEVADFVAMGAPIPDERVDGLWGVYRFKRGFGGRIACYVGAHDFVFAQRRYALLEGVMRRASSLDQAIRLAERLGV